MSGFAAPSHSRRRGIRHHAAWYATVALLVACDRPDTPTAAPEREANLRQYVAGQAAATLNSQGRFSLAAPTAPDDRPIITPERAGALALAYIKTYGSNLRGAWEKERGGPVNPATLQVDPQILYAGTPYGRFPDGFHPAFHRAYGPFYLVRMTAGADPVLLVAVSAYSTEVEINQRGILHRPVRRGNEFVSRGLPVDTASFRPISPEEAVESVGRLTGARVTRTPELIRVGLPYSPISAVWKLTLDREVRVKATGAGRVSSVREVFVGPERQSRLMIPQGGTTVERTTAVEVTPLGDRFSTVEIPVRNGESISFQEVTPAEEGA